MNIETRLPSQLWEAIRTNYEKRDFKGAILDAFYYLSELLRKKSGTEGDGAALIGNAFGGANPKIKLNKLQSESETNVQKGVEQLLRGLYQAIRNPRSHEKISDSEEDAQSIILFIGYLIRQIDQARAQFSRQDSLKRILDPDFVPQNRYAELLVNEIPVGHMLDLFVDLYRSKEKWKSENIKIFLTAFVPKLLEDQKRQMCEIISDDLKTVEDEASIRIVVHSVDTSIWSMIEESARLRIENRIIRSIGEGSYDTLTKTCRGGAFATWASHLFPAFTLKNELIATVINSLYSDVTERGDYVFQYMIDDLGEAFEKIPSRLESAFKYGLQKGRGSFHLYLNEIISPWPHEAWSKELKDAYDTFQKAPEPAISKATDDEVPF